MQFHVYMYMFLWNCSLTKAHSSREGNTTSISDQSKHLQFWTVYICLCICSSLCCLQAACLLPLCLCFLKGKENELWLDITCVIIICTCILWTIFTYMFMYLLVCMSVYCKVQKSMYFQRNSYGAYAALQCPCTYTHVYTCTYCCSVSGLPQHFRLYMCTCIFVVHTWNRQLGISQVCHSTPSPTCNYMYSPKLNARQLDCLLQSLVHTQHSCRQHRIVLLSIHTCTVLIVLRSGQRCVAWLTSVSESWIAYLLLGYGVFSTMAFTFKCTTCTFTCLSSLLCFALIWTQLPLWISKQTCLVICRATA